jgi:pimeloyl-ACP methyl ester carboxylesterase
MKRPIIILHGWKLSADAYKELVSLFKNNGHDVYALNLPGFGNEPLKNKSMTLSDYVEFVREFINKKKLKDVVLIGHSFGGRVALKYAWKYPLEVSQLVLTGVPIIRHISSKKQILSVIGKTGKVALSFLPENINDSFKKILYKSIGEWDYYKSNELKNVFVNVVNEDLVTYAKEVTIPVLLLWGELDKMVPANDVQIIKTFIKKCKTEIIKNAGHTPLRDNPRQYFDIIKQYI